MEMQFHHIGIACSDIASALSSLSSLYEVTSHTPVIYDSLQDAQLCLIRTNNGLTFELVSGGQAIGFIKKHMAYYHVCYTVTDLDAAIEQLTTSGAMLFVPPKPAILFDGRRVAFLMTNIGMMELLEAGNAPDPK